MRQLVLPFEELLADEMEHALYGMIWGIDWGFADMRAFRREFSPRPAQWAQKLGLVGIDYYAKYYAARISNEPWTQLLLPLFYMKGSLSTEKARVILGKEDEA